MHDVLQVAGLIVIAVFVGLLFGFAWGGLTAGVECFALGLALEATNSKPGDT